MSFCSLLTWKLLFYTKSRLGFLFSNMWMLEVLYWRKKTQNIIIIISIVLQLHIYSHFLSGTWNKHAEYAFTLFSLFLFLFPSPVWYLHGTESGSFMLFNFLWFCLYCMYFFRGFWGRPRKYRSARERGRTCIFTGYPPPLQLQSGLLCTCITEAPNKTHCGWLVRKRSAPCVWLQPLHPQTFTLARAVARLTADVSHKQTRLIHKALVRNISSHLQCFVSHAVGVAAFITHIKKMWGFFFYVGQF